MNRNPIRRSELLAMIETNAQAMTDEFILNSMERAFNEDARRIYRAEAIRRGLVQPNSAAEYAATKLDELDSRDPRYVPADDEIVR